MKIYGICGRKMSGKDTFATFAAEALYHLNVEKHNLADPLKSFCMDYLGLSHTSCYGSDVDKNRPVGNWGDVFNRRLTERYGKSPSSPISGREIMQVVGTDIFRESFRETFWVDIMTKKTVPECARRGVDVLFIADVRFRNEVSILKAAGAKIIRIRREVEREEQIQHPSELEMEGIPDGEFCLVVENTTLTALRGAVSDFLKSEGLGDGS